MAAEIVLQSTLWYTVSSGPIYVRPPQEEKRDKERKKSGMCVKRGPSGTGLLVEVLAFDKSGTKFGRLFCQYFLEVSFHKDYFSEVKIKEALERSLTLAGQWLEADFSAGALPATDGKLASISFYGPDPYTLDGHFITAQNFLTREGVRNVADRLEVRADRQLLINWVSRHWEPFSWTEHYYRFTSQESLPSEFKSKETTYKSNLLLKADAMDLYEEVAEKRGV